MAKKSKKPAAKAKAKKAAPSSDGAEAVKRLSQIFERGGEIRRAKALIEKQETLVAEAESSLKAVRTKRNSMQADLDALRGDLEKLADNKFSERLQFGQPAATTSSGAAAVIPPENVKTNTRAVDADAWKAVKLGDLGVSKRALAALNDFGLKTFGDAEEHFGKEFPKQIPNFGEQARQSYDDAKVAYFIKNSQPAPVKTAAQDDKSDGKPHTAAGDKPGTSSRGAGVTREKKALHAEIESALAFATLPIDEVNVTKVLTKLIGSDPIAALETATLDQVERWRLAARGISDGDLRSAVQQHA